MNATGPATQFAHRRRDLRKTISNCDRPPPPSNTNSKIGKFAGAHDLAQTVTQKINPHFHTPSSDMSSSSSSPSSSNERTPANAHPFYYYHHHDCSSYGAAAAGNFGSYPPPGTEMTILMNKDVRQNPMRYIDSTLKMQQLRKGERLKKLSETTCQPLIEIGGTKVPITQLVLLDHQLPTTDTPLFYERTRRSSRQRTPQKRRKITHDRFVYGGEEQEEFLFDEQQQQDDDDEYAPRLIEEEPELVFPPDSEADEDEDEEAHIHLPKTTDKSDKLNRKRGLIFGDDDEADAADQEDGDGELVRKPKRDRKKQDDKQRHYLGQLKSILPNLDTLLGEQHQSAKLNTLLGARAYVDRLKRNVVRLQKRYRHEKLQNHKLKKEHDKLLRSRTDDDHHQTYDAAAAVEQPTTFLEHFDLESEL